MRKIHHSALFILGVALTFLTLASCNDDLPQPGEKLKGNTVIVYMGAENSLAETLHHPDLSLEDLNEMKKAAHDIPEDCQVVVYRDAKLKPIIYHITQQGMTTWKEYPNELDSADPANMENILEEIIQEFPSEKYSLVLWSHGSGWMDDPNKSRAIIVDNNNNTDSDIGNWLNINELSDILASLPRMEYIFFDACYMQSVEVASQLYSHTPYIIGSPTEIPGEGAPYHRIMGALCQAKPQEIINGYASYYGTSKGVLLSAVSCADFPAFCTETAKYIPSAFNEEDMPKTAGIQIYAPAFGTSSSTQNDMPVPYDMRSAMYRALSEEDFAAWEIAWKKAILYPTWAETWESIYRDGYGKNYGPFHRTMQDPEHYGGISMNIPNEKYDAKGWNAQFRLTPWYSMTSWEQTGW